MFSALKQIDNIDNIRSLKFGVYVLGPFLVLMTAFLMWMQVEDFYFKHEKWRVASFAFSLIWNYVAVELIRKCHGRIHKLRALANQSLKGSA